MTDNLDPGSLLQLTDPEFFREGDPYALWRAMRAKDPVAWTPDSDGPGFWSVTGYHDGLRVLRDSSMFAASSGTLLEGDRWKPEPAGGKMLALMDPPRHTQLRHTLHGFFTPRRISELRESIAQLVRKIVADASAIREFDFAAAVARPLAVHATRLILGVTACEGAELVRIADAIDSDSMAKVKLFAFVSEIAELRKRRPGNDLLSALLGAELEGRRLSDEEVALTFMNVLSGGIDTTRLAAAGGVHALMQSSGLWEVLSARPGAIDEEAVEEILRWTTPIIVFCRTATSDLELGSRRIRRKDRVAVWLPSLNRDETMFLNPDVFSIARRPNRHVTFGGGGHLCIGAGFARLELKLLFDEILVRWKRIEATGPPGRYGSLALHGFDSLPVRVLKVTPNSASALF